MCYFIYNISISILAFASWYFAGLGISLVLLPRRYQSGAFLLAPLIGMSLLVLIGLFQITVLLTPIIPRINIGVLVFVSLLLCIWKYHTNFQMAWKRFCQKKFWMFGILPLVLLLTFSWMFYNEGFQLLVGSSDQLQYSANARQIYEEMHTHSSLDIPVPRQDHYVYDMDTHILPYLKTYRRGAEVMLVETMSVTGLNYEESFSVTVLCALLTLGLALAFVGKYFLRFSRSAILITQLTFLSSFYLLLLYIQGSLALLMALAPALVGLALLTRALSIFSWHFLFLTAILIAADLSLYAEPSFVTILLPSLLLVIYQFCKSPSTGFFAMQRIGAIYLFALICTPYTIYSVWENTFGNFSVVYMQFLASLTTHFVNISAVAVAPVNSILQQWNIAAVILGNVSYYDSSAFNGAIAEFIDRIPWIPLLEFSILCSCSLLGYFKTKNRLSYLFSIILICWIFASFTFSYQQDTFRFVRSFQYAMPWIMIGLVLLANRNDKFYYRNGNFFWVVVTWLGRIILAIFIFMNIYTCIRTISYIVSHNVNTDKILLRFNEKRTPWKELQEELHISAVDNAPVLISGFKDTIHPLALAIIMRSQPHILGTSILSFWSIYFPATAPLSAFNSKITKKEFQKEQMEQNQPWPKVESDLIEYSKQAVTPIDNGYPTEWKDTQDIFPPYFKRFTNICDVVYRNEYSVTLSDWMISLLKKDTQGSYHLLWASGPIMIHNQYTVPHKLTLIYEGKIGDIKLKVKNHFYDGIVLGKDQLVRISVNVYPEDAKELKLIVKNTVKLRSISWTLDTGTK